MVENSEGSLDDFSVRKGISHSLVVHMNENSFMSIFEVMLCPHFLSIKPSLIIFVNSLQRYDCRIDFSDRWKGDYLCMPSLLSRES